MSIKRNIFFLLGGTALAQIFTFAISPILTRLYTPDDFGVLGIVLAASSIIATSAHMRLNLAIALTDNLTEAKKVFVSTLSIIVLTSLFCIVGLSIVTFTFTLAEYTFFVLFSIFILSIINSCIDVYNYWQSYRLRHKESARNASARALLTGFTQVFMSYLSGAGLIIGIIIGGIGSLMLFFKDYYKHKENKINAKIDILYVITKYKTFPLYSMPQGFLASFSLNLAPLVLGAKFGIAVAGQYWLAYRILLAPIALFGGAYKQVLHPLFSDKKKCYESKIKLAQKHTVLFLVFFLPIIFFFFYYSTELFTLFFGENWSKAGIFASWLVLCFGLDIAKIPSVCLIHAFEKHKDFLIYELILAVFRVLAVSLGVLYLNDIETVTLFSIVSSLFSIVLMCWCLSGKLFRGKIKC